MYKKSSILFKNRNDHSREWDLKVSFISETPGFSNFTRKNDRFNAGEALIAKWETDLKKQSPLEESVDQTAVESKRPLDNSHSWEEPNPVQKWGRDVMLESFDLNWDD